MITTFGSDICFYENMKGDFLNAEEKTCSPAGADNALQFYSGGIPRAYRKFGG